MTHVLVTNDFPPKVGGIQSYLWELWRRLPPRDFAVLTTAYPGAAEFDRAQPFAVLRTRQPVMLPTRALVSHISALAERTRAGLVVLDPALPVGIVGSSLQRPYAVVLHGAEVTVPARLPGVRHLLRRTLRGAHGLIAAGEYPAAEARRLLGDRIDPAFVTVIPPGVDVERFRPLDFEQRAKVRADFGLPVDGCLVVSVSRLVPRKGMDVLIDAAARLAPTRPDLTVAIAGAGRDRRRLDSRIAAVGAPVIMLGRIREADLADLYGCADVFAMLCRDRWGGLEQEGFGIVFLEAAACGVAQIAGRSGGATDAVLDGRTGLVVERPGEVVGAAAALGRLLDDAALRRRLAQAARDRAEAEFSHDVLAGRLAEALRRLGG